VLTAGVHQQLIDINRQAPRALPKFVQEGVQPIDSTSRLAESICRPKNMDISVLSQVLRGSVGRIVVDYEESVYPKGAIVFEKRREAKAFVSALRERTYFLGGRGRLIGECLFNKHVTMNGRHGWRLCRNLSPNGQRRPVSIPCGLNRKGRPPPVLEAAQVFPSFRCLLSRGDQLPKGR
jgi:hypothetical protein